MEQVDVDTCEGTRCGRGSCIGLERICDGVRQCEDGNDESEESCHKKEHICNGDPFHSGCGNNISSPDLIKLCFVKDTKI